MTKRTKEEWPSGGPSRLLDVATKSERRDESLVKLADERLYAATQSERNCLRDA
jgi:hypothetical protein